MVQSNSTAVPAIPQKAESAGESASIEFRVSAEHDPRSLLDLLSQMPHSAGIEFDPQPVVIELRAIDFDAER